MKIYTLSVVGAGPSSPMGIFYIMIEIDKLYDTLIDRGFSLDKNHHTHSQYVYDSDGICVNRGDWLQNIWTGRKNEKATPKSIDKLKYLLDKQARLEILGGWVTKDDREVLHYYLMEYYFTSIDFPTNIDKIIVDIVNDICRDNRSMLYNDLLQDMKEKGGKVSIDPNFLDLKERSRLYKKGEKKFNEYWIEQMIKTEPGKTAYYYHKYSKEFTKSINGGVGWSINTIKNVLQKIGE